MIHPTVDIHTYLKPGVRVHLAGIGGVSMCPLAEVLRGMGLTVQGSDMSESDTVRHLRSLGIDVAIGHSAENLKDCDLAGVLGGLTLGIVEVCRAGDDGVGDGLAEVGLSIPLQLHQDLRGNLLRGPLLAVDVDLVVGSHVALNGGDSLVGVGNGLTLCRLAHQSLSCLCKSYYGRRCAHALGVGDNGGLSALHHGYTAVCCT